MADIELLRKNLAEVKRLRDEDAEKLASNTLDLIGTYSRLNVSEMVTNLALIGNANIRQRMVERTAILERGEREIARLEREERRSGYGQS